MNHDHKVGVEFAMCNEFEADPTIGKNFQKSLEWLERPYLSYPNMEFLKLASQLSRNPERPIIGFVTR